MEVLDAAQGALGHQDDQVQSAVLGVLGEANNQWGLGCEGDGEMVAPSVKENAMVAPSLKAMAQGMAIVVVAPWEMEFVVGAQEKIVVKGSPSCPSLTCKIEKQNNSETNFKKFAHRKIKAKLFQDSMDK